MFVPASSYSVLTITRPNPSSQTYLQPVINNNPVVLEVDTWKIFEESQEKETYIQCSTFHTHMKN